MKPTKSQVRNGRNLARIMERANTVGVGVQVFHHAYRLNDCVDIYKKMHTVHDLDTDEYHKFTAPHVALKFALEAASNKRLQT